MKLLFWTRYLSSPDIEIYTSSHHPYCISTEDLSNEYFSVLIRYSILFTDLFLLDEDGQYCRTSTHILSSYEYSFHSSHEIGRKNLYFVHEIH